MIAQTARDRTTISIHALHEESDYHVRANASMSSAISIHALHEESDPSANHRHGQCSNFNPRSP